MVLCDFSMLMTIVDRNASELSDGYFVPNNHHTNSVGCATCFFVVIVVEFSVDSYCCCGRWWWVAVAANFYCGVDSSSSAALWRLDKG